MHCILRIVQQCHHRRHFLINKVIIKSLSQLAMHILRAVLTADKYLFWFTHVHQECCVRHILLCSSLCTNHLNGSHAVHLATTAYTNVLCTYINSRWAFHKFALSLSAFNAWPVPWMDGGYTTVRVAGWWVEKESTLFSATSTWEINRQLTTVLSAKT